MKKLITYLTVLAIIVLVAGTVIEKIYGTSFALTHIYHSVWFAILWWIWGVFIFIYLIKNKTYKNIPLFLLYFSFLFIIAGLTVTTFTAQTGKVTLQSKTPVDFFINPQKKDTLQHLPFSIQLDTFQIITYSGTHTPQDFISEVQFIKADGTSVSTEISMNHIARHNGYRFYQSGYIPNGEVVLTVTHDPWGIGLTYVGYCLLICASFLYLLGRKSALRELWRQLSQRPSALLLIGLFLLCAMPLQGGHSPRTLPKESAEKMGKMYVLYNERICPLQTLAQDFTTKLYGSPTYHGLTPEQVLSGWMFYFSDWRKEPMFKIKGDEVCATLEIEGKYASLMDFHDELGQYRLTTALDTMSLRNPLRSKFLAANEKYDLIVMLYSGELLKIFPVTDSTGTLAWCSQSDPLPLEISDTEYAFIRYYISYCQELVMRNDLSSLNNLWDKTIEYQKHNARKVIPTRFQSTAERWYNRCTVGKPIALTCIFIGLLFFAYALLCMGSNHTYSPRIRMAGFIILSLLVCYLFALFATRWYVAGHIPMSNGYETMLFLALCVASMGIALGTRHPFFLSGGMLLTGLTLLVAMMGGANPTITHLMPVLASPLLCIHVTVIMVAYALLAFIMLNGISAIVADIISRRRQKSDETLHRLQLVSRLMLYPTLFMLALGIIFGAIWANVSWGSYWSWDPKEVWALITLIVYALPLHQNLFPHFRHPHFFHWYNILAFFSVIFTYFGVNFLLGGMHSYIS